MALSEKLENHRSGYNSSWGKHKCYGNPFNMCREISLKVINVKLVVVRVEKSKVIWIYVWQP